MAMWKVSVVMAETAESNSGVYAKSKQGLLTRPVKIGPRASAWPSEEVQAIMRARIAGKTDDEIRDLVRRLMAARQEVAA